MHGSCCGVRFWFGDRCKSREWLIRRDKDLFPTCFPTDKDHLQEFSCAHSPRMSRVTWGDGAVARMGGHVGCRQSVHDSAIVRNHSRSTGVCRS